MAASATPTATRKLLSGNEAIALGAVSAGVKVAAAYPGTPSTEILEELARFPQVYAEWAPNEKVALEVAIGASFAGARAMASMKHVGLNVAADPFFAVAYTGVEAGLVVVTADDPGMHSSQNEQDNRLYAKFAKVPLLEPSDSQEAYDLIREAFVISEQFDTPVLFRSTTRISHSKSAVVERQPLKAARHANFLRKPQKYVMLPANARTRRPKVEERLARLRTYAERFPRNQIIWQDRKLGVVASGVAYQYAREVFCGASFLKLTYPYPFPRKLIQEFAGGVERVVVVEELEPFLEEAIRLMGIPVVGKDVFPAAGELSPEIVESAAAAAGLVPPRGQTQQSSRLWSAPTHGLPPRPPVLCAGCPHTGTFYVLKRMGFYRPVGDGEAGQTPFSPRSGVVVTGDIGCYTLGALPPLMAMDSCLCMGASIGNALGMQKAGMPNKIVAVIGDSTFLHSGITPLLDVAYNRGSITVVILDNGTTAMTGHQGHPGTGVTARGETTRKVDILALCRALGVENVREVGAFDLLELERALHEAVDSPDSSVLVVRGPCVLQVGPLGSPDLYVDAEDCDGCGICLHLGCPAIALKDDRAYISVSQCMGCDLCIQVCPREAISRPAATGARA